MNRNSEQERIYENLSVVNEFSASLSCRGKLQRSSIVSYRYNDQRKEPAVKDWKVPPSSTSAAARDLFSSFSSVGTRRQ